MTDSEEKETIAQSSNSGSFLQWLTWPKPDLGRAEKCDCKHFPQTHDVALHLDSRQATDHTAAVAIFKKQEDLESDQDKRQWWQKDCNCSLSLLDPHFACEHCTKCGKMNCSTHSLDITLDETITRAKQTEIDEWGMTCRCVVSADIFCQRHYTSEHCSICGSLSAAGLTGLCDECMSSQTTLYD